MKSKMFLGLTTCLLVVAGVFAHKVTSKGTAAHIYFTVSGVCTEFFNNSNSGFSTTTGANQAAILTAQNGSQKLLWGTSNCNTTKVYANFN